MSARGKCFWPLVALKRRTYCLLTAEFPLASNVRATLVGLAELVQSAYQKANASADAITLNASAVTKLFVFDPARITRKNSKKQSII